MIDVNEIKEAVEKIENHTYIMHKEIVQKNEEILEHVFTECGYTVEEVMELHKAGRLNIYSSDIYGFRDLNYTYLCEIDGEQIFVIRVCDYLDAYTNTYERNWSYEILKRRSE